MVLNLSGFFVLPLLAIPCLFRTHFVILTMRVFFGRKGGWGPCWVVLAMSSCLSHAMVFGHSNFVMDYDEACFMHLTPGVVHNFQRLWVYRISVPYAQKDPRFLFEKIRGQPREFWSLVSTIDGSTLPQDCVEEQLC